MNRNARRNRYFFSTLPFLVALSLFATACVWLPPESTRPTVTIEETDALNIQDCIRRSDEQSIVPTSRAWVQNEIVFFGSREDIVETVQDLSDSSGFAVANLEQRFECDLSQLFDLEEEENARRFSRLLQFTQDRSDISNEELKERRHFGAVPLPGEQSRVDPTLEQIRELSLLVFRVEFEDAQDDFETEILMAEAVAMINEIAQSRKRYVIADPNYLVGVSGSSLCGNPNSVGASPNSVGASPFELTFSPNSVGASPVFGLAPITDSQVVSPMLEQRAFGGVATQETLSQFSESNNIRVAIFDTHPFTQVTSANSPALVTMDWPHLANITDVLSLNVWNSSPVSMTTGHLTPPSGSNEHGLFVAGLVHAVAPNAQIDLIRILNDAGCGDLATLAANLYMYIAYMQNLRSSEPNPLDNVVINMSLGVHQPLTTTEILSQVNLLVVPINAAYNSGAIIISAAGNDSGEVPAGDALEPTHRPAAYGVGPLDHVLGVSASNASGSRACFANGGDLAAFGGEGMAGTVEISGTLESFQCLPSSQNCVDNSCEWGLVSVVSPATSPTGFAYWSGTSFSAPIVSGLAALIWGNQPDLPLLDVSKKLKECAAMASSEPALGEGVLHLDCVWDKIRN